MWFVKALLGIVLLAAALWVGYLNINQEVSIYLTDPNIPSLPSVPLAMALLGAFILGILVWFVVSFYQVVSAKSEVAALKRKNRQLSRELTDLRNMPVKDLDPESLVTEGADDEGRGR
jgi:uncharacterized integral membrane protein